MAVPACRAHRLARLPSPRCCCIADVPASARSGHSAAAKLKDGGGLGCEVVIFGGEDGTMFFNDVHVLDCPASAVEDPPTGSMQWLMLTVHGERPEPRAYHSAVMDHTGKVKTLCGAAAAPVSSPMR